MFKTEDDVISSIQNPNSTGNTFYIYNFTISNDIYVFLIVLIYFPSRIQL